MMNFSGDWMSESLLLIRSLSATSRGEPPVIKGLCNADGCDIISVLVFVGSA